MICNVMRRVGLRLRHRMRLLAALSIGVCLVVSPAIAAVFGTDTRTRLPASDRYFSARVGQFIALESGAICTAFCVAREVVVTAGHCINGTGPKPPRLSNFVFRRTVGATILNTRLAGARIGNASQSVLTGSTHLQTRGTINAADDWAVVRLDQAVCPFGGLQLSAQRDKPRQSFVESGDLYQIAVHRDLSDLALYKGPACRLTTRNAPDRAALVARDVADAASVIMHGCDSGGGSSGSPLLINGENGPEVIALSIGTYWQPSAATALDAQPQESKTIANLAVVAGRFAKAAYAMASLDGHVNFGEIRQLQRNLRSLGLFTGAASGRVSDALIQSVRAFERRGGFRDTGLITQALLDDVEIAIRRR